MDRQRRARAAGVLLLAGAFVSAGCRASRPPAHLAGDTDARIRYHERQVERNERHHAAWAELAAARLQRARRTHAAVDVRGARAAAQRSLRIQPSFAGLLAMAAVSNFAHRFEHAEAWADRAGAAAAMPADGRVTAQRVEALLGLGRIDDARTALAAAGDAEGFFVAAARGHVLVAEGRLDEAVQSFLAAERAALGQAALEQAAWARISAGGVRLDAGDPERARRHLAAAEAMAPESHLLRIHQAELLEAEGREAEALALYERLASMTGDPMLHARAHAVALALGEARAARRHFAAAEAVFLAAIDAGEVYTLGPLAALYADAGVHEGRAREYARRNLEFTRDAEARRLMSLFDGP